LGAFLFLWTSFEKADKLPPEIAENPDITEFADTVDVSLYMWRDFCASFYSYIGALNCCGNDYCK